MQIESNIQRWGNSLAVRLSGMARTVPKFEEGMPITIEILDDGIYIRKVTPKPAIAWLLFTEAELLSGLTPYLAHADETASLSADEWGV
jgi:antitoxin MazE